MSALQAANEKLSKFHGNMTTEKNMRDQHHSTLDERVCFIEQQMVDSREKAVAAEEGKNKELNGSLKQLHDHVKREKEMRDGHYATVSERLDFLEKLVGESADKYAEHVKALQAANEKLNKVHGNMASEKDTRDKHHATLEERVTFIEQQIGESAENNSQALAALANTHKELSGSLSQLHSHVSRERESREGHHATVDERLEYLEKFVGDSAEKHEKHMKALAASHAKLESVSGIISAEQDARHKHHATMNDRLDFIEKQIGESAGSVDIHAQTLAAQKISHKELRAAFDKLHAHVKGEKEARESHHATVNSAWNF